MSKACSQIISKANLNFNKFSWKEIKNFIIFPGNILSRNEK